MLLSRFHSNRKMTRITSAGKPNNAAPKTEQITVALAGNPNVGKSTVFNALTGLKQHTGNWAGKTVSLASGMCTSKKHIYEIVDLPGTYSLMPHSAEEEIARDYLCSEKPDLVIIVCDATCLERNLNLVLQTLELTSNVIICINLIDEAHRKNIYIDTKKLSELLGVPVVCTAARSGKGIDNLIRTMDLMIDDPEPHTPYIITYPEYVEQMISSLIAKIREEEPDCLSLRWNALSILTGHDSTSAKDIIASTLITTAEQISSECVSYHSEKYNDNDRKLDRLFTGKWIGFPVMFVLFALIFWITITGANYPSELLSDMFGHLQTILSKLLYMTGCPRIVHDAVIYGIYRVLSWVVSVMLPPMAIFFPLFTFLEDVGYLPRIAFNLDRPFKCCRACGKQALTMCMGFGCNAVGVTGCRIIDSPRERLLAILTNNFGPCTGRFPAIIALITVFFAGYSLTDSLLLSLFVLIAIIVTFLITYLLSKTVLKGTPSSFTLELPPYRRPLIGKIIVRSIFDRTLFILRRAVIVAAPAGLVIWLIANIHVHDMSLLTFLADKSDPFARFIGLDGVILIGFILGSPANEIVIPIILIAYLQTGYLSDIEGVTALHTILISNGWTAVTAVCTILFALFHWPCTTTLITIYKETRSLKWTALSVIIQTGTGIMLCAVVSHFMKYII